MNLSTARSVLSRVAKSPFFALILLNPNLNFEISDFKDAIRFHS